MLLRLSDSKLVVILKFGGGRLSGLVLKVCPGYEGMMCMGKAIPGRGKTEKCSMCLIHG